MTSNLPLGSWNRRDLLSMALVALATPLQAARSALMLADEIRSFRLTETEGLRRFGYPVHTIVPGAVHGRNFRLVKDGRAIPAQFRVIQEAAKPTEVALDFVASPEPLQTSRYEVQYGPRVEPGPEPATGLSVEERQGRYHVTQGTQGYTIDPAIGGFLRQAGSPRLEYLRGPSLALTVGKIGQTSRPLFEPRKTRSMIVRQGPIAVGFRFVSDDNGATLDLTIPQSKSWVQAVLTLKDPEDQIQAIALEMDLLIEGTPTLVDFGAGSTFYGQLLDKQRMELVAGKAAGESKVESGQGWVVRQGEGDRPQLVAASTPDSPRAAEGWAHVMDARRCTAFAVEAFGKVKARDKIEVRAGGLLRFTRDFAVEAARPAPGPKSLAFWVHFVPMPVHAGALTSPQSILAALRVDWDR